MKMYIAVREEVPDNMVPVLVAHSVLRHHLHMTTHAIHPCQLYAAWLPEFKKCVVKVNNKEYNKILTLPATAMIPITESWENTVYGGNGSCITVVVGDVIPNVLKYGKLWKPKECA